MPSRAARAREVTLNSLALALFPAVATLLSLSNVARALAANAGAGITFPFPTGLPTLWTYVSLPSGPAGPSVGGPLSITAFVPLFVVGLLVTAALEAGFLGSLWRRLEGDPIAVWTSVRRYTLRMVGVNLLRFLVVLAALPLFVIPPLALLAVVVLSYLVYGLPFQIVARDVSFGPALRSTVSTALSGGSYAVFGIAHLLAGAAASVVLTGVVLSTGPVGVLAGTAVVAVPAVFVATYGLLVFSAAGSTDRVA